MRLTSVVGYLVAFISRMPYCPMNPWKECVNWYFIGMMVKLVEDC